MDDERPADRNPLYDAWFGALSAFARAPAPLDKDERAPSASDTPPPFPVGRISEALKLTEALLNAVFAGYFRALMACKPGEEPAALKDLLQGLVARYGDALAGMGEAFAGRPDLKTWMSGLAGTPLAGVVDALKPISTNLERTYGGLADAFGLAPLRELEAAGRDMAFATLAHRGAQAEYLEVALEAAGKGIQSLMVRLAEMGERGESVDTMLALVRLWAKAMDEAMHEAMQSPRALQASADLIRAAARSRQQQQRVVAIVSEALNIPTRAEVDEAFREIQALKRELRRLRKPVASAPLPPAATRARKRST